MIKVCKFGGTSTADGIILQRVGDIIRSDPSRRYIVVSAPGKRYGGDEKVTDLLLKAHESLLATGNLGASFQKIKRRFLSTAEELGLKDDFDVEFLFSSVEEEIIKRKEKSFTLSRGEYLTGRIVSAFLQIPFLDAKDVFRFTDGVFDSEKSFELIRNALAGYERAVLPGFYGGDGLGKILIFPRGGSDISGAVVARAVHADCYENWTDVNGFLAADPRIVDSPARIEQLTFGELRTLSAMGANVLHPESAEPVRKVGIPVWIRDTFRPEESGTLILPNVKRRSVEIAGIAGKNHFTGVRIFGNFLQKRLLFKLLNFLDSKGVDWESVQTGADTLFFVFEKEQFAEICKEFLEVIRSQKAERVEIIQDLALVAAVGQEMKDSVGTSARILRAIAKAGVNLLLIARCSALPDLIVGVDGKDFERTVRAMHDEFFRS